MLAPEVFEKTDRGVALAVVPARAVPARDHLRRRREDGLDPGMDDGAGQHLAPIGDGSVPALPGQAVRALCVLGGMVARAVDRQQAEAAERGHTVEPLDAPQLREGAGEAVPQLPDGAASTLNSVLRLRSCTGSSSFRMTASNWSGDEILRMKTARPQSEESVKLKPRGLIGSAAASNTLRTIARRPGIDRCRRNLPLSMILLDSLSCLAGIMPPNHPDLQCRVRDSAKKIFQTGRKPLPGKDFAD